MELDPSMKEIPMSKLLALGSQGPAVFDLQAKLNCHPTMLPRLTVDGLFGKKTQGRVLEFQKDKKLAADGIVGPKTQGMLNESLQFPPESFLQCANCLPENKGNVMLIRSLFSPMIDHSPKGLRNLFGFNHRSNAATPAASIAGVQVQPLDPMQEAMAINRFGTSLDLKNIFITDKAGLQNRPFTVAIPSKSNGPTTILLNMGSLTPPGDDLVHELAHAWQAQHHLISVQFMDNSIKSQAAALALNTPIGLFDAAVRGHKGYPAFYPYSPYAYEPGKKFSEYAGEQIAQQVQRNEAAITAHIKSVAAGKHDPDNALSLSTPRIEDRRKATVKI